jgi:hypothetical protein
MTPSQKTQIDLMVDKILGHHRSSEKKDMLRENFTKGMTNVTMVTADEQASIALTILILSQLDKGKEAFEARFDPDAMEESQIEVANNDVFSHLQELGGYGDETMDTIDDLEDEAEDGGSCTYQNSLEILEVMLSFHAWYKSDVRMPWDELSASTVKH